VLLLLLLLLLLPPAFLCEVAIRRRRSKGCTTGKRQARASKARTRGIYGRKERREGGMNLAVRRRNT
jgi:hypothetical protein